MNRREFFKSVGKTAVALTVGLPVIAEKVMAETPMTTSLTEEGKVGWKKYNAKDVFNESYLKAINDAIKRDTLWESYRDDLMHFYTRSKFDK